MMYSILCCTNISFAAALVYPSAKDKSQRELSEVPFAFDVKSEICGSQNKVDYYKDLLVHSFVFLFKQEKRVSTCEVFAYELDTPRFCATSLT